MDIKDIEIGEIYLNKAPNMKTGYVVEVIGIRPEIDTVIVREKGKKTLTWGADPKYITKVSQVEKKG